MSGIFPDLATVPALSRAGFYKTRKM